MTATSTFPSQASNKLHLASSGTCCLHHLLTSLSKFFSLLEPRGGSSDGHYFASILDNSCLSLILVILPNLQMIFAVRKTLSGRFEVSTTEE